MTILVYQFKEGQRLLNGYQLIAAVTSMEVVHAMHKAFYPDYELSGLCTLPGVNLYDISLTPRTNEYKAAGQGSYTSKERYPRGWDPRYDY